jgi:flagellar biosynthesis protein FlhF
MELKKFRARTMHEALALVRRELGPDAAVLHTREVRAGGMLRWLAGSQAIEITASAGVNVPSRLPSRAPVVDLKPKAESVAGIDLEARSSDSSAVELRERLPGFRSTESALYRRTAKQTPEVPESLFRLFTDLIEAEMSEELARELLERVQLELGPDEMLRPAAARACLLSLLEDDIDVAGSIRPTVGRRHLVALVGPTGVGKTTTIAKLAAHYRLRERLRVGLITVDTYRIAAVEQLRTYADIIDLPMEVVSTPREMRQAVARLSDLDLVLMDTAGRCPRDEVRIQELKSMLVEAQPDEVHLVLSCVGGAAGLAKNAERFAAVGTTALILTKLDEATGLGNLLPLLRTSRLPVSYLTNGQNVPDDIEAAVAARLARRVLGFGI